jgi:predicted PurR-regulated permease PerM
MKKAPNVHFGADGSPRKIRIIVKVVMSPSAQDREISDFAARVLVLAAMVGAAILLWRLSELVLLAFASVLIAVAWRGCGELIAAALKIPRPLSLLIVAFVFVLLVALPLYLFGAKLSAQYDELALDVPESLTAIKTAIESHPWWHFVQPFLPGADLSGVTAPFARHVASVIGTIGQVLTYAFVALLGGAYLAFDPDRHIRGSLALSPRNWRDGFRRFFERSGSRLRQWLSVQLFAVVFNGVAASIGLWLGGVVAPVALGTLSGALAFIPYAGSIAAMAIGALAALSQGSAEALYAAGVIGAASFVEGYFLTPYLQSRALSLPPIVLIFAMLAFGALFGPIGLILAAPATVVTATALETMQAREEHY